MTEEEIKQMHIEAESLLKDLNKLSDRGKRIAINCFKHKWWGINPAEAVKIGK